MSKRVLIIDDPAKHGDALYPVLNEYGFSVERRETSHGAIRSGYDAYVVFDLHKKGGNVGNLKRAITAAIKKSAKVILVSGFAEVDRVYDGIDFDGTVKFIFVVDLNPRKLRDIISGG